MIGREDCVSYLGAKKHNGQEEETFTLSVNSCNFYHHPFFECKFGIRTLLNTTVLFQLNEPLSEKSLDLDIVELDFTFYGGQISLAINDLTTHVIIYSE
jgi:hypothetical protein